MSTQSNVTIFSTDDSVKCRDCGKVGDAVDFAIDKNVTQNGIVSINNMHCNGCGAYQKHFPTVVKNE